MSPSGICWPSWLTDPVLVVEVKPGNQTSTLAWTPFQVAQYMSQMKAWAESEPDASKILNEMIRQREQLRLIKSGRWKVSEEIQLVPVIAIGLPVKSREIDTRFECVHAAVHEQTPSLIDGLEIWGVEPEECGGKIGRIKMGSLRGAEVEHRAVRSR